MLFISHVLRLCPFECPSFIFCYFTFYRKITLRPLLCSKNVCEESACNNDVYSKDADYGNSQTLEGDPHEVKTDYFASDHKGTSSRVMTKSKHFLIFIFHCLQKKRKKKKAIRWLSSHLKSFILVLIFIPMLLPLSISSQIPENI